MMKLMIVGRRAPGTTRQGAQCHLRDVHGPMVVSPPVEAGQMPLDYVQNHVIDGAYPGAGAHAIERDLVTELWFENIDGLRASTSTPYYLANLRPDESNFVDDSSVVRLIVVPRTFVKGSSGRFKLFLLVSRANAATWDDARAQAEAAFAGVQGLVSAIANDVLPPPTGDAPFVDLVIEGWFETAELAAAPVAKFTAMLDAFGDGVVDRERSFAIVAEQYDTARLRGLHG
jgi:EthD domain